MNDMELTLFVCRLYSRGWRADNIGTITMIQGLSDDEARIVKFMLQKMEEQDEDDDLHDQCIHGYVCGGDCANCDDFER